MPSGTGFQLMSNGWLQWAFDSRIFTFHPLTHHPSTHIFSCPHTCRENTSHRYATNTRRPYPMIEKTRLFKIARHSLPLTHSHSLVIKFLRSHLLSFFLSIDENRSRKKERRRRRRRRKTYAAPASVICYS